MDGGPQSGRPPFLAFFSFVLSLEDMRSRKELAEDWLGDKDGVLVFVRRTSFSIVAHYDRGAYSFFLLKKSVWTFLGVDNRIHHRR